jgi:hypothetical protein
MDNHIGAIWYFIHDYNAQQLQSIKLPSLLPNHHPKLMADSLKKYLSLLVSLYD